MNILDLKRGKIYRWLGPSGWWCFDGTSHRLPNHWIGTLDRDDEFLALSDSMPAAVNESWYCIQFICCHREFMGWLQTDPLVYDRFEEVTEEEDEA